MDQQRVIIEHLLRFDVEQAQNHEELKMMIKEGNLEVRREFTALAKSAPPASPLSISSSPTGSLTCGTIRPMRVPRTNDTKTRTIEHYCDLIDNLLGWIDFEAYDIDSEVRTRIRNDVVEVHKRETRYLKGICGAESLKDAMRGKYWKLADMDGERYPLARAMHNKSSSSLPDMAKTAASDVAQVAETMMTKPPDAKTSNTCPDKSTFEASKEVGTETAPQSLRKEVEPLPKIPSEAEVPMTRLSASPKGVSSEELEAIDGTRSVSDNCSQPDGPPRQHLQAADPYHKSQQAELATAENLVDCAVKILDQETESREEMLEQVNPGAMLIPLLQSGTSERPDWGGDGFIEKIDPLRQASIPLHNAHRKKPHPKFNSSTHPSAGSLPDHGKSRQPALPREPVVEVPRQAVKFGPPIANAQSLPLNYAMGVFLNDQGENPVTQKQASGAGMPAPAWLTSPDGFGTSMMGTQSSRTQDSVSTTQDLPGLTISSKGSTSSQGDFSLAEDSDTDALTIRAPGSEDSANDATNDAIDEAADSAAGELECPFNQLGCLQTFAASKEWITHNLTHFGSAEPPTTNRCTFCEKHFHSSDAAQSWTARMNHVAHHHRLGHKLTGACWDNTVYIYTHMYVNGLLSMNFFCEYLGRERDRRDALNVVNSVV